MVQEKVSESKLNMSYFKSAIAGIVASGLAKCAPSAGRFAFRIAPPNSAEMSLDTRGAFLYLDRLNCVGTHEAHIVDSAACAKSPVCVLR
jgi:hypothetical protein